MKFSGNTIWLVLILSWVLVSCGGGGDGGSGATSQTLQPFKVYCPDSLQACGPTKVGSDIYIGYKVNGTPGSCPSLLTTGQPAFDAFGTTLATGYAGGIEGTVSLFSNNSGPVTSLKVAPNTPIACCVVFDTQGLFGPDSGDPFAEADCWPFHDHTDQNNMEVSDVLP